MTSPLSKAFDGRLADFELAWAARDATRIAALFTMDADYVDFAGDLLHGRDAIERAHTAVLAGPLSQSSFRFVSATLTPVTETVALGHTRWELAGQRRADGSDVPIRRGIITFVVTTDSPGHPDSVMLRAGHNTESRTQPFD